jgi:hypothetical protein
MMEAASTSESSLNFYQTTRRNIPEDGHLHTRRRENLKSLRRICWINPSLLPSCCMCLDSQNRIYLVLVFQKSVDCSRWLFWSIFPRASKRMFVLISYKEQNRLRCHLFMVNLHFFAVEFVVMNLVKQSFSFWSTELVRSSCTACDLYSGAPGSKFSWCTTCPATRIPGQYLIQVSVNSPSFLVPRP